LLENDPKEIDKKRREKKEAYAERMRKRGKNLPTNET